MNPFTPSAECWPTSMEVKFQEEVKSELQRLFDLLGVRTGIFNVECRVCQDGKVYLMEVSPRGGGNRLAEMLDYAADVDLIEAEVKKTVGLPVEGMHEPNYKGCFAIQVLHAPKRGVFDAIILDRSFMAKHLVEKEIRVNKGDEVAPFTGANTSIGTLFLRADSREEMDAILGHIGEYVSVMLH